MRRLKEDRFEQKAPKSAGEKINGIDTEALFATIDAIKADASKASCKFFAATEWRSGTVSDTKVSKYELGGQEIKQDYTIATDEPGALLGTDTAPNPQMLLYAALNSCVLNTFVVNAAARGIRIDSLRLDLEGELDLRGFLAIDPSINAGYDELTLVCRVKGNGTKEQYQECLDAGTRFSPNFQSMTRAVNVHYKLDAQ
jgi:uncharacterized OsmC-like protein